ncbi:hypothetical protein E2L07_20070 [Halalkalibacterium halodurans]|uniref:hypothetical protein n=1 Tax=Halalkalibacterium halodurans TaxID=86665 RepID=UPI00106877CC|nr:hypothetical protein [Halalkalibacterium halodurans]TES45893.1 hypothetical protein E2L07_20070 [Halalkalibacterium halodurans]
MLTTRGRNIFYFIIAGLILIGLVIFFGSKFVLGDDSPVLQSDFNVEYNELDNTYITLRRWEYNPKKDLMEIEISTRSVSNFAFAPELKFSAKTRKDPDVELSVKKVFQLDGVYVVQVQHVPEDFEVVALVIEEEERHFHDHDEDEHDHDHGNEFINKPVLSLYGDYRKLQHNIELTSKSEVEYIEEQINFEIEQLLYSP